MRRVIEIQNNLCGETGSRGEDKWLDLLNALYVAIRHTHVWKLLQTIHLYYRYRFRSSLLF